MDSENLHVGKWTIHKSLSLVLLISDWTRPFFYGHPKRHKIIKVLFPNEVRLYQHFISWECALHVVDANGNQRGHPNGWKPGSSWLLSCTQNTSIMLGIGESNSAFVFKGYFIKGSLITLGRHPNFWSFLSVKNKGAVGRETRRAADEMGGPSPSPKVRGFVQVHDELYQKTQGDVYVGTANLYKNYSSCTKPDCNVFRILRWPCRWFSLTSNPATSVRFSCGFRVLSLLMFIGSWPVFHGKSW